jgi:hypothetical protein
LEVAVLVWQSRQRALDLGQRLIVPESEVSHEVLDRPLAADARLLQAVVRNIVQRVHQRAPARVDAIQQTVDVFWSFAGL